MNKYTKPDFDHAALLIIDMQNDFALPGSIMEVYGTYNVIPTVKKVLRLFRTYKKPIFHMVRLYKEDGSNADICRKETIEQGEEIASPNSDGAEIVEDLKPGICTLRASQLLQGKIQTLTPFEYVLYKPRWGAFYETSLEKFLKKLSINTLIIAGCNFPNCPRATLYEASQRDFKIVMIDDAVSGLYEKGIEEIERIGGSIFSVEKLEKAMQIK